MTVNDQKMVKVLNEMPNNQASTANDSDAAQYNSIWWVINLNERQKLMIKKFII